MNNFLKTTFLFLFLSCSSVKEKIDIIQEKSHKQAYAILSNKKERIVRICFPKKIILKNNSNSEKSFVKISYHYNSIETSIGNFINLFENKANHLKKISNNKKKTIAPNNSNHYTIYTTHYIEKNENSMSKLKKIREMIIKKKQDTLHIGTVSEFKQNHKKLFERLTKNDSISIQFLDGKKLGEKITKPVEW